MSKGDNVFTNEASLFKQAFDFAPVGTAIISMNGAIIAANTAICSLLGYTNQEFGSMHYKQIVSPEDWELLQSLQEELVLSPKSAAQSEIRFIQKDGSPIKAAGALAMMHDDQGAPSHFIWQLTDGVKLRFAERKSEEQIPILSQFYDFVSIHDAEGAYLEVSPSFHEILGYSREEIIGEHRDNFFHPEDLTTNFMEHEVLNRKKKKNIKISRFRKKDGHYVWLEFVDIPVMEPHTNRMKEMVVVARDITECSEMVATLDKTRHSYQIISENAFDIITIISPGGVIEYTSPAVSHLLGYQPEELIDAHILDLCHPDDLAVLPEKGSLSNIDIEILLNRTRHKEGHYIWLETAAKAIWGKDGKTKQILCVSRDVTKRKQAEDELRTTKERLESFIANNADAIWMVDHEGRILEVNAAFEQMFQWKASEILSRKLPIIPPSFQQKMEHLHEQVFTGNSFINIETIRVRKDGSFIEVCTTLSPVRDSGGRVIGISGTCRDISERKRAKRQLEATTEQLAAYMNQNVEPVLILNTVHEVIRVNHAFEETFGWTYTELAGRSMFDLPNLSEDNRQGLVQSFESMKPCSVETICVRADGVKIPTVISLFPLLDKTGNYSGWAINLRDMTANKQAEQFLINSEKLSIAGQLAAGIAHEIRNPITAIKGFIHLMKSGASEKKYFFEIITSEIERIEMILSELLILAKPQLVRFERRDIRILLRQVVTLLDTQAILNNVQIITRCDSQNTFILCDENQLKQVCINFIKNAIEAMPDGGKLEIQLTSPDAHSLMLRFKDDGCGIPAHIISKLGQPFYTTKEKGTGLGFMVSKKIIENHKGTINVSSQEQQGTTIDIILPAADVELAAIQ